MAIGDSFLPWCNFSITSTRTTKHEVDNNNNKKKRVCRIIDIAVPCDYRINDEEIQGEVKYQGLNERQEDCGTLERGLIPTGVGALGFVTMKVHLMDTTEEKSKLSISAMATLLRS